MNFPQFLRDYLGWRDSKEGHLGPLNLGFSAKMALKGPFLPKWSFLVIFRGQMKGISFAPVKMGGGKMADQARQSFFAIGGPLEGTRRENGLRRSPFSGKNGDLAEIRSFLGKMAIFRPFCLAGGLWFFKASSGWPGQFLAGARVLTRFWSKMVFFGGFWGPGQKWSFLAFLARTGQKVIVSLGFWPDLAGFGHFGQVTFWGILAQKWSILGRTKKWPKNGPFFGTWPAKNYT